MTRRTLVQDGQGHSRTIAREQRKTSTGSALSMRADLVQRRVWLGDEPVWVVKDPLSRALFYFSDQEHEILSLADGRRSLSEIARECSQRYSPQYISGESLVRFFADARKNGLVLVDGSGVPGGGLTDQSRPRWWHNPLAIRMPGLNPDRFLDWILPVFRPVFSPAMLAAALLLMLVAASIAARDFALLSQHLSTAAGRLGSGHSVVLLVAVVSLTKIMHELAHALACKRFGGECRELGLMFLVGVPCLYCDVSDAWLMDRRWKRILVSAAGMLAELTLAAVATVIWMFTVDGPVRDLCVTVMVVCSVSTVLFNGNPLLRYDGYYILSDLAGIPNLAPQSAALIRGWFRRLLWATPVPPASLFAGRRHAFVLGYGIASGSYRTAIYVFILFMLYRVAESHEMGGPAGLLLLLAIASFCFKRVKSILTPPDRSIRRASISARRPAWMAAALAMTAIVIFLVPLPGSVVAPMSIQPAGAQTVFVTGEGAIGDALTNGAEVSGGQTIAWLHNPEVDRQLAATSALCDRLAVELDSLRQRRSSDRKLAAQIPVVEQLLAETLKRKHLREKVADRLTIKSPRHGRVFAPPSIPAPNSDDRQPRFWTGTPLEPINRGAWLTEGAVLCIVGDPSAREAIVLMRQQEIESVRMNQHVTLLLADWRRGSVTGRVLEVSATPSPEIPAEFERGGLIDPPAVGVSRPPYYQVRVKLDATPYPLPVRLTGYARITVTGTSILTRLSRFLSGSFG